VVVVRCSGADTHKDGQGRVRGRGSGGNNQIAGAVDGRVVREGVKVRAGAVGAVCLA
jgi:hypothetical protein